MTAVTVRQGTVFITATIHMQLHALAADAVKSRDKVTVKDLNQFRTMMARGYQVVGERAMSDQVSMPFTEPDYFAMVQVSIAATVHAPKKDYTWFDQLMYRIARALGRDANREWPKVAEGGEPTIR